ncbi:MAG: bifunctional methylenetetrahydrofolate dehydrogenase/methenyltetrahydrofolate cyclohydrolase, partial [Porphyrobacter sp.]|nr:bifunctional methylenetetrahydrofolate dehydrogenase/methenyltetrahydrofolate cyclohydrolase [Porphyrobacter sp.]
MTARLIDGKAFAAGLRQTVADYARAFEEKAGRKAALAVVLVGDDPASHVYVASKTRAVLEADMASLEFKLSAETSEDKLLDRVRGLSANPDVDGILVQLPLPEHINENRVIAAIAPSKDVDGFN